MGISRALPQQTGYNASNYTSFDRSGNRQVGGAENSISNANLYTLTGKGFLNYIKFNAIAVNVTNPSLNSFSMKILIDDVVKITYRLSTTYSNFGYTGFPFETYLLGENKSFSGGNNTTYYGDVINGIVHEIKQGNNGYNGYLRLNHPIYFNSSVKIQLDMSASNLGDGIQFNYQISGGLG